MYLNITILCSIFLFFILFEMFSPYITSKHFLASSYVLKLKYVSICLAIGKSQNIAKYMVDLIFPETKHYEKGEENGYQKSLKRF